MIKPQPVHRCGSLCKVECDPPAPGGPSLGSVMKEYGDQKGAMPGQKPLPEVMPMPYKNAKGASGGRTEQPQ